MLYTMSMIEKIYVLIPFACSIFYEEKAECKLKPKGDNNYYFT